MEELRELEREFIWLDATCIFDRYDNLKINFKKIEDVIDNLEDGERKNSLIEKHKDFLHSSLINSLIEHIQDTYTFERLHLMKLNGFNINESIEQFIESYFVLLSFTDPEKDKIIQEYIDYLKQYF